MYSLVYYLHKYFAYLKNLSVLLRCQSSLYTKDTSFLVLSFIKKVYSQKALLFKILSFLASKSISILYVVSFVSRTANWDDL